MKQKLAESPALRRRLGVELPSDAPQPGPCVHLGEPTGDTAPVSPCCGRVDDVPVHSCALHGRCTVALETLDADAPLACCAGCKDSRPRASIVVNQGAGGLGDALQGLLTVAALRRENPAARIVYRVSKTARPFVALWGGYDALEEHQHDGGGMGRMMAGPARQLNNGYGGESRPTNPTRRWERYGRNARLRDPGAVVPPALRDAGRLRRLAREYAGCVVLAPFSTDPGREFDRHAWARLASALRWAGYRVVVLHHDAGPARALPGEVFAGRPAADVAGLLLNAACLVGVDSGPAHLAGLLGTPAVVLCRAFPGARVFGCYPSAAVIDAPDLDPDRVRKAADRAGLPAIAGGRSIVSHDRLAALRDAVLATNHLPGDVAELGVFRGGTARLIGHYAPGAPLHLFDTFTGLPADCDGPGPLKRGDLATPEADVREALADLPCVFHVGLFPATAPPDARYRFFHFDGDLETSCEAFVRHAWPRLAPGGRLAFDDFTHPEWPGVERVVRRYFPAQQIEETAKYQVQVRKPEGAAVVTLWDDAYELVAARTWPRLRDYAGRRGHAAIREEIDPARPAAWSKIPALLRALEDYPVVLWVDADAVITGDADPTELLGGADVALAADCNGLNTGVMALRACDWVKSWLRAAWDLYPRYEGHPWYEQPALVEGLGPQMGRVRVLPQRALNAYHAADDPAAVWQPGDFVLHLPGLPIARRLELLTEYGVP